MMTDTAMVNAYNKEYKLAKGSELMLKNGFPVRMRTRVFTGLFLISALCAQMTLPLTAQAEGIQWVGWSDSVFTEAKKQHKFVILDLEAVWCHWCHVMDHQTYANPEVIRLINEKYIAVRVDQDSRPDLSNRYLDYGWPATIVFSENGEEIVKRAGYIEPKRMASLLQAIIEDPSPEKPNMGHQDIPVAFAESPSLSKSLQDDLETGYMTEYDFQQGGWGTGGHKFLDADSVDYALSRIKLGDKASERMANQTLQAELKLIDPVWGGVYQYSANGDWDHPHYEKIMSMQAEVMRVYAESYALLKNPEYLKAAESIHRYLKGFMTSPEGAFYTSQDADLVQGEHSSEYFTLDDMERRKLGMPRIDKHLYARENGWAINSLTALYMATGDNSTLEEAVKAADWVIQNRSLPGGGFRHDETDAAGPFLGDTLSMGRAFLSLYSATGDRQWLTRATDAADYINVHFKDTDNRPGFASAEVRGQTIPPLPQRDENVMLTRFANLLHQTTGNAAYLEQAQHAMRYLATPVVAQQPFSASVLLAAFELGRQPVHITIVGHKGTPEAKALYQAAMRYPASYKRLDWWDKREGPLPNPDVQYPEMDKAAAFVCTEHRCSLPVFNPDSLGTLVDRLTQDP
jgi:uncharacterized protein